MKPRSNLAHQMDIAYLEAHMTPEEIPHDLVWHLIGGLSFLAESSPEVAQKMRHCCERTLARRDREAASVPA